ncbi:MAG: hypothetical protein V1743_01850 [Nanoarchaeota archaeon]
MTYHIIDSYAWVEYFNGSAKGKRVQKLLLNQKHSFSTIHPCLAELHGWALKNSQDFNQVLQVVRANSDLISLSEDEWIQTGKERFFQRKKEPDFGLIDAAILVKQKELHCKVISGDRHFRNVKNVVFLT